LAEQGTEPAFGPRQSLDTVGAFLGPLLAVGLMLLWANDFRAVFWMAVIPGLLAVALLVFGVREPERQVGEKRSNPIRRENLKRLSGACWWVVGVGAVFTLARFSDAFLVLRTQQGGIAIALVPLVMVAMNVVYAASAYPFGSAADMACMVRILVASWSFFSMARLRTSLQQARSLWRRCSNSRIPVSVKPHAWACWMKRTRRTAS